MTSEEAMRAKEVFDLCLQINVLKKREIFFETRPDLKVASVRIFTPHWEPGMEGEDCSCYLNDIDLCHLRHRNNAQETIKRLKELLKEDMRHDIKRFPRAHAN
nr:MAG TPA: hypothetical protein [Caudoviricetes sp.]